VSRPTAARLRAWRRSERGHAVSGGRYWDITGSIDYDRPRYSHHHRRPWDQSLRVLRCEFQKTPALKHRCHISLEIGQLEAQTGGPFSAAS
jgi:hypothetical protein